MCFSETASFVTAAVTIAAGATALIRAGRREELPLAATPVVFGAQQAVEGLLWVRVDAAHDGATEGALTVLFLLLAKVFWPIFAPIALLIPEPDPSRRRLMTICLAMGLASAAYFAWSILTHAVSATASIGHIVYSGEPAVPLAVGVAYFLATGLAPLLSTFRTLQIFGAVVLTGYAVSWFYYWDAFSSVWCFFAAAASAILVFHFERVRQLRNATAGP